MAENGAKGRRTKGANGNGGASRRADGSWQWRVTLEDGRRVYGYDKDQREAKRKCLEKVAQLQQGVDPAQARQTVGRYLDWWLADVVTPARSPKTTVTYRDVVRLHIEPTLGRIALGKLTAQQVAALLRAKEREGKSARTVAMIRAVLHTALAHAVKLGMVGRNVVALVDAPAQHRAERQPLTPDEARQLLAAAEGDRLAALYRLTLMLGLRRGEVLGLRWRDVDLDAGELRVTRNLQRVEATQVRPEHAVVAGGRRGGTALILKEPKTKRSRRTLVLSPSLVAALRSHRDRQAFEQAAVGARWQDTGLVFTTPLGTGIDPDNLGKEWKALLGKAGLRDQRFHDLRHAAASLLLADGVPVNVVSQMLGHSLTSTTMDIYGHAMPAAQRETAAAMERLLG